MILARVRRSWKESRVAWLALAAMAPVYFISYFQRSAIPGTIFNEIQSDLQLSATAVAGLGSLFLGIYAITQPFVGMVVDRFGGRRMLLAGGLLMAAGGLWFPGAGSSSALYAARSLTGLGASFMFLSIVHEIEALFGSRRFPAVLGLVLFVGYAGGMSGTLPFAAVTGWLGWRQALFGVGLAGAAVILLAWGALRRLPAAAHAPVRLSFRPLLEVLACARSRPLLLACLTNFSVFFVVQNVVGKKFLQDVAGLTSRRAAAFVLVMAGVSAAVSFLSGFWLTLSRQRRKPVLMAFGLVMLAGVLLLTAAVAFRAPPAFFLAAYILMAAGLGGGPTCSSVIKELNRPGCVAQSVAVLNAVTYLGVAVLAWISGRILDAFQDQSILSARERIYPMAAYLVLFLTMSVTALFSWLCLGRVPETWKAAGTVPRPEETPLVAPQTEGTVP